MSGLRPLRGACNCGRNHYSILVPADAAEQAQIYFDYSNDSRRSQAAPVTAWLRVPLLWYSSTTQALFADETHSSIRKIFTPPHVPHSQRIFCGYCGTHLTYWTEQPPSEAEYLNVTLGSILNEDLPTLEELDLFPDDVDSNDEQLPPSPGQDVVQREEPVLTRTSRSGRNGGLSWFEEMIDGSRLGRTRNIRRGQGVSADGSTRVEWEISEYTDDGTEDALPQTPTGSKRKIGAVGDEASEDVKMRG